MTRLTAFAAVLAAVLAFPATATAARAVALSDASSAPHYVRYVYPGMSVTRSRQCGQRDYWTNYNAYQWNGRALGAQRWTPNRTRTYWRDSRGGRVIYDGITVTNATRYPILFAAWCG